MKKIKNLLMIIIFAVVLTACGKTNEQKIETKGKCNVFECIKKISSTNTLEEMNKIIGFDGENSYESNTSTTYKWKLSEDTSIEATINKESKKATLKIWYPSKMITKYANFSKWDEIEKKYKSTSGITYDEIVKLVGNVEGTLSGKSDLQLTYNWYDENNGYMFAYINPKTNKCTLASGRF